MPSPRDPVADVFLGNVLSFLRIIWALDHGLQRTSKRMAAELGLTGPQRMVVRLLGRFPGASASEIAQVLHLHPSTITGVLQRLEERGVLRRRRDARDSRRSQLFLTRAGRRLDVPTQGTVEAAVERALAGFSAKETRSARDVLTAVAARLGEGADAVRHEPGRPLFSSSRRKRKARRDL